MPKASPKEEKAKTNPWLFTVILIVAALLSSFVVLLSALFIVYGTRNKHTIEELSWNDIGIILLLTIILAIPFVLLLMSAGFVTAAVVYLVLTALLYYWQKGKIKANKSRDVVKR